MIQFTTNDARLVVRWMTGSLALNDTTKTSVHGGVGTLSINIKQ